MELLLQLLFIFTNTCSGQDIEYYPSQSAIDAKSLRQAYVNPIIYNKPKVHMKREISLRYFNTTEPSYVKREVDPVFHGHPKTREEMWNANILNESTAFDQNPSLIKLIHEITVKYLNDCTPIILYDSEVSGQDPQLIQDLFKDFPVTYAHGQIDENDRVVHPDILRPVRECIHFIVFLVDLRTCRNVIGMQATSRVVVVARTSQWAIQEFLGSKLSRKFVNLLVIGQSVKDDNEDIEAPYILYTHKLYIDGLGASMPVVLNSWTHSKFSREIDLFPPKMTHGYAGHRFVVAAANQPPFVVRRIQSDLDGGNPRVVWDGIEIRILKMLAERNNFSLEIIEPLELQLGPGDAVTTEIMMGRADIGIGGMYMTIDRTVLMDMSYSHSQDCAVFITLMSTALPRYRAILGPFHWHVWVALTFTYLIGIFPLAFSDKHTLRHLLHDGGEVENMFWYVFGTFTNCFTFAGKNSWSKTTKITTRLLIGWYWIFTIIITSCYTGSIIAFVTLPVFPETVDTIEELLKGFFRLGTLDRGGWERWFFNSSDPQTNKLLKKIELVPDVAAGIRNTTKAFFWPYAFLGSEAELEYIIQANFTMNAKKREQLHISDECFVPFGVSMGFPNQSLYTAKLSGDLRRMIQSGLLDKITDEVRWAIQRGADGQLLAAGSGSLNIQSAEEKGLTLEDTQGMFLLLVAGYLLAAAALMSEWMGGCTRKCRLGRKKNIEPTISSANSRDNLITTPKSDFNSEVKIIPESDDSFVHLNQTQRPFSAESKETLDGEIIHVSDESITVHSNLDMEQWGCRRSSSVDLDREVQEIFDRDQQRRRVQSEGGLGAKSESTVSKGVFGDHIDSTSQ